MVYMPDARVRDGSGMTALRRLGRALLAADDSVELVFDALAQTLTAELCDGCAIDLAPIARGAVGTHRRDPFLAELEGSAQVAPPGIYAFASSDEARTVLPRSLAPYIDRFGLRGLVSMPLRGHANDLGVLVATRDATSIAFGDDDLDAIQTCVMFASGVADRTLRLAVERSAARVDRARMSLFGEELLGIVSHDLHAPLSAIVMGAERLGDRALAGAGRTPSQIVAFARRMTRMLDQVLDMARLRLGSGLALSRCRVRLVPLVRAVLEDHGQQRGAERLVIDGPEDVVGYWDPDRIGQVIAGLVRNALQYGRPGGSVSVEIHRAESRMQLVVWNEVQGNSIVADAAMLFEAYRRGAGDDLGGAGLGLDLYIAREIAHAHGGTLTCEATSSTTSFIMDLPVGGPAEQREASVRNP